MKRLRWWIVGAYVLATAVAQGVHDHGGAGERPASVEVGCHDPRAGLAGHHTPAPDDPSAHCPACHSRVQPSLWTLAPAPAWHRPVTLAVARVDDAPPAPIPLRHPGRGPPVA